MMKKLLFVMMALVGTMTAGAQEVGEITDSVKAGLHSDNIKEAVNTVKAAFEKKTVEAAKLVGTWTYVEPVVMPLNNKLLSKATNWLADNQLEKLLREYVDKANVTPQNTSITLLENGTFNRTTAGRKQQGVWMVNGNRLMLGINNVQIAELTTLLKNDTLKMVVEASRVLSLLQAAGALSDTKTHKALIKIAKRVKGQGGGFVMARKEASAGQASGRK
jgi:hypothetical protein